MSAHNVARPPIMTAEEQARAACAYRVELAAQIATLTDKLADTFDPLRPEPGCAAANALAMAADRMLVDMRRKDRGG